MDRDGFVAETGVSRETADRLAELEALLNRWNPRINLVARSTLKHFWARHVLDSWQVLEHAPPAPSLWLDLGSGGGFPGLIIALCGDRPVTLVESDARKCAFLREAARHLGLAVTIENRRIETLPTVLGDRRADVISARALAALPKLLGWAAPLLSPGGKLILLKGQDVESELTEATKYWKFDHELFGSRSDSGGAVLVIEGLRQHDHLPDPDLRSDPGA